MRSLTAAFSVPEPLRTVIDPGDRRADPAVRGLGLAGRQCTWNVVALTAVGGYCVTQFVLQSRNRFYFVAHGCG